MAVRVLHCHSTFALGGKEARSVSLINALGECASHTVLTSVPGETSARAGIAKGVDICFPDDAPPLTGLPGLPRLFRLSRYMRRFDLVLTYNWGAFDAVMARHLFGGPPLIHHEDGFNEDEADQLKTRRNLYRRLGLSAAYRLVVPSRRLEAIARRAWGVGAHKIVRIPNGIPVSLYSAPLPAGEEAPSLGAPEATLVIGTVAGLRPVKNVPRLVRAFAAMQDKQAKLVIVGEGPESERIAAEARACGVADRVSLRGFVPEAWRYMRSFDVFALSSDSEQFPIAVVEAMAAGLPVVATSVGDVFSMVSADNQPLIVDPSDEAAFTAALDTLAERSDLRNAIGRANREKAVAEYDSKDMIGRYGDLYGEAIGVPDAFNPVAK